MTPAASADYPRTDEILFGDNLDLLPRFADGTFQLIYIDPPFNTGKAQTRKTLQTVPDESGDRTGFMGRRYVLIDLNPVAVRVMRERLS